MAAESSSSSGGYTLQQWLALQEGKRTRIEDALPENSNHWMAKYYTDRDGDSSWHSDTFGAQPSCGPAVWQFGEEYGGLLVEVSKQSKNKQRTEKKKNKPGASTFFSRNLSFQRFSSDFRIDNDMTYND